MEPQNDPQGSIWTVVSNSPPGRLWLVHDMPSADSAPMPPAPRGVGALVRQNGLAVPNAPARL
jgi:hypothetical protein